MDKRGMEDKLTYVIWEVIVIFMVVIVLTISVKGIANNTSYWKKYHSTDIALMSDLMVGAQGDISINYDMKDLKKDYMTRILSIDPLIFEIVFQKGSVFVFDVSHLKDRFPQSYIFARDRDVKVLETNTTNDYIVIYKQGDTLGLGTSSISQAITCPSDDTTANLLEKRFEVISIKDDAKAYSDYADILLRTVGKGSQEEALFLIVSTSSEPTTIYHEISSGVKGEKMSCLIRKDILSKHPDMNIMELPYSADPAIEIQPFTSKRDPFNYWLIIQVNVNEIQREELGNTLKNAITQYYVN